MNASLSKPSALIVNPYVTDFKLYDEWMHPLGLYALIDLLVSNGVGVQYFNCIERLSGVASRKYGTGLFTSREIERPELYKDLKRKYKCFGCSEDLFRAYLRSIPRPDVIFVGSMMTYWADGVLLTLDILRAEFPGVPLVCGGIGVTLLPGYFRVRAPDVTFVTGPLVQAEGEMEFPGIPFPLVRNPEMSLLSAFKQIPLQRHAPLLLTLGCPMRCAYCASHVLQPQFVRRSIATVISEMEFCITYYGVGDFALFDDALLVDANALLLPFLDYIIVKKLPVRLHTPNGLHLKYVDERLLEKMQRANFTTLRFGYESGAEKHRKMTSGKADFEILREKLELVRRYGFPDVGVYIMGGLPESNSSEMALEMRMIASWGVKVKPVFLSPVPGTLLFNQYSRAFPHLADDPLWQNDSFFITQLDGWSEEQIEMIRKEARLLNSDKVGG